jgi:uncharacterized protein with von Willebrand factor type A (vWA) domain
MKTKQEFLRLSKNEPLTLLCSAIADFLWDDFIRDARPIVKYIESQFKITQLSRFGKEVFDRLYTCDQVEWLVSEDDYEQFFREVCDGNSTTLPKGYKPENSFWWMLMSELSNSAAWPELICRCVGNQFNSGNNAVSLLNQLSEAIEQAIATKQIDVQVVFGSKEELEKLREEFKQAMEKGDTEAANAARQKGKELGNRIIQGAQAGMQTLQGQIDGIVDKTIEESDELNDNMSNLWGSQPGQGRDAGNLEEKKKLAAQLKSNSRLKKLAAQLGALKRTWIERKRAKRSKENYESIVGAKFGNDITKAFVTEIALANTREGKALFAMKYAQKTLLTKDYEASSKNLHKGPVIMYIDVSGSMNGPREIWSKAISFVIAEEALRENREVQVHLFDVSVSNSIELKGDRKNNADLIDYIQSWFLGGGTRFDSVLHHAGSIIDKTPKADVLMITDGHSTVSEHKISMINAIKARTGTQWTTICLEVEPTSECYRFSDDVYSVNLDKPADAIDAIQKSIR